MADVRVIQRGKKWVVLVNFISRGCEYSCKATAEAQAEKIRVRKLW